VVIVAGVLIAVVVVIIFIIVVTAFSRKSKPKSPALMTTVINDTHDDNHGMSLVQTDIEKSDTTKVNL
jgi:uncharacterized membrane protein YqiK